VTTPADAIWRLLDVVVIVDVDVVIIVLLPPVVTAKPNLATVLLLPVVVLPALMPIAVLLFAVLTVFNEAIPAEVFELPVVNELNPPIVVLEDADVAICARIAPNIELLPPVPVELSIFIPNVVLLSPVLA
jgi:hypothetical protein